MNQNKRYYIFLFTIIFAVFLFGVYQALSVLTIDSVTVRASDVYFGNFSLANATARVINFTITTGTTTALTENVTNVTIILPSEYSLGVIDNKSNSSTVGWFFANLTDKIVQFTNDSIGGENLTSAVFSFNVTAKAGNDSDNTPGVNFTVIINNGTGASVGGVQVITTRPMPIDTLIPKVLSVNITDGNETLVASSFELNGSVSGGGDTVNHTTMELRNSAALTVNAIIVDVHTRTVELRYNYTYNGSIDGSFADNSTVITNLIRVAMTRTNINSTHALYSGNIDASALGGKTVNGTRINLQIVVNDSLSQTNTSRNEFGENQVAGYNFTVKSLDGGLPTFIDMNVSDATNILTYTHLTQGNQWLSQNNHTLTVKVSGINISGVGNLSVFYNATSGLVIPNVGGGVNGAFPRSHVFGRMVPSSNNNYIGIRNTTWNFTIQAWDKDGQRVHFVVRANDTQGYNVLANFSYRVDGTAPTASLNTPADVDIAVSGSIIYECTSADSGSGINQYTLTLTKPQGGTVEKTPSDGKATFTGTDTNELGTYQVECKVKDNVGNIKTTTTTSENDFVVLASTGGTGGGGGAGGAGSSGTGETTVEVEPEQEAEAGQVTTSGTNFVIGVQGTVNFDVGTRSHSVKVLEVMDNQVTIEISSTPVVLTMIVGESKNVDLDDDGVDDLVVTLNRIVDDKADLTFESFVTPEQAREIEEAAGEAGEQPTEGKAGKAALWITIIIILIILGVGYYVLKKKR